MSKIKVLVTGAHGLVGSRFIELAKNFQFLNPDLPDFDITNFNSVQKTITDFNPDWIINFAAFTDVNASEDQSGDLSGLAWKVNVEGVQNLVTAFKSKNIIHISTDMVFPGNLAFPGPYAESDTPPDTNENLTWYGWTKNRAEKIIKERGGTILRIIYPVRASFGGKADYIRSALQKFSEGKLNPLFTDQQICIAYIDEVAKTLEKIIETNSQGVFHASSDTTTPFELISFVVDQLGKDSSLVPQSSIVDFLKTQNNPNRYPVWGGLKTKITEEALDIHFSTWQTVVEYLIAQGLTI